MSDGKFDSLIVQFTPHLVSWTGAGVEFCKRNTDLLDAYVWHGRAPFRKWWTLQPGDGIPGRVSPFDRGAGHRERESSCLTARSSAIQWLRGATGQFKVMMGIRFSHTPPTGL